MSKKNKDNWIIQELPEGVQIEICKYLSPKEINIFGRLNKKYNKTALDHQIWSYKLKQYFYVDPVSTQMSAYNYFKQRYIKETASISQRIYSSLIEGSIIEDKISVKELTQNYLLLKKASKNQPLLNNIFEVIINQSYQNKHFIPNDNFDLYHWAAICNQPPETLANFHTFQNKTKSGKNIMHLAVLFGHIDLVKYLLTTDYPLYLQDTYGNTALHLCSNTEIAELLVKKYPKLVAIANNKNALPLHKAVFEGHFKTVKLLVNTPGIDVDAPLDTNDGLTPLHLACLKGHVEIATYLIRSHAKVDIRGEFAGFLLTPLALAVNFPNYELVDLLLKNKANIDHVNYHIFSSVEFTAFENAVLGKLTAIINLMNENRLDRFINEQMALLQRPHDITERIYWQSKFFKTVKDIFNSSPAQQLEQALAVRAKIQDIEFKDGKNPYDFNLLTGLPADVYKIFNTWKDADVPEQTIRRETNFSELWEI